MQFEIELWDAINRYAISVGGDPSAHVYGNVPRMQAVADVGKVVARVQSRGVEIDRLRAALRDVRGFLRGVARRPELGHGARDLIDEAAAIGRSLDEKDGLA